MEEDTWKKKRCVCRHGQLSQEHVYLVSDSIGVKSPGEAETHSHTHMYPSTTLMHTQIDTDTYTGARKAFQSTLPLDLNLTVVDFLSKICQGYWLVLIFPNTEY